MNKNTVSASEPKHSILVQLLEDYQNKQFDSAEKSASLITQQFPEHPFAWKLLGALLNQTGRFSEALIACQKSVLLDKNNAEAHNNLGHTLYKLDRLEEAESSYRKSIEIDPKNALAYYNLGQALGKQGNLEQSEISYKEAIALRPNYIEAYNNLGIVLKSLGRLEEAEELSRHEINLDKVSNKKSDEIDSSSIFQNPKPLEYSNLYRRGMGTENVGGFLRSMAHMLRPNRVLEIGAGYTTPFLLQALVDNRRIFDDGNLQESYFDNYSFDPKLVIIDDMSLGELSKKPGMKDIISSTYVEFIHGKFEDKSKILFEKYGYFDFVWFDCGGPKEYEVFLEKYWHICSHFIFFHFTYYNGSPNKIHEIIDQNLQGELEVFDIVEPHKKRQGSVTMVKKIDFNHERN
jgi:tetratricopeptide (TPR) repeat protein